MQAILWMTIGLAVGSDVGERVGDPSFSVDKSHIRALLVVRQIPDRPGQMAFGECLPLTRSPFRSPRTPSLMSVFVKPRHGEALGREPSMMINVHAQGRRRGSRRRSIRHSYAGWIPQDHGVRLGASSVSGRASVDDRPQEGAEGSPDRPRLRCCAPTCFWADQAANGASLPVVAVTCWPIAQIKPTNSRATAVMTTFFGLPVVESRR